MVNAQNIIPEWETPKGLVLVYPEKLYNRSNLINFYNQFIKSILKSTELSELTLIVKKGTKSDVKKFVDSIESNTILRFFETEEIQDIWARDFCPIFFANNVVYKSLYRPNYFTEKEIKYSASDDKVGIRLSEFLNLNIKYLYAIENEKLILDGGNFIQNGNGTAIVTNRLISDNESLSISEIKDIFNSQLNISNLIILPVEPGDETGHIDGMVRFIDRDKVLVASYPVHYTNGEDNISEAEYKTSKYFLDRIADVLEKHFVVNRIECAIPIINKNEEMPSSFGNYINFLRLGNIVYIPQYGIPQDANAIDKIKSIEPQLTIIKVSADIEKLAKFGGVLNCISWQYY